MCGNKIKVFSYIQIYIQTYQSYLLVGRDVFDAYPSDRQVVFNQNGQIPKKGAITSVIKFEQLDMNLTVYNQA
jgi:hypothetical protein